MFNSLKFRIAFTAFLLVSIIMTITTWRDIRKTQNILLDTQKQKAELLSDRISHGIMVLMLRNRWQDLQTMMESLVKDSQELKEIRIFLPDSGKIVVSSDRDDIGTKIYEEDLEIFHNQKYGQAFLIEKDGQQYASKLTAIKNLPICHKCHGSKNLVLGVLDLELSLENVQLTIKEFEKGHIKDATVGFLLVIGAFLLVIGVMLERPITNMINTIKKIETGDLTARMKDNKKDELGLLAKSFNNMVETLESAKKELELTHTHQLEKAARLASLGEILSGVAHEIKNPLTGISCAMQVFQSKMSKEDQGIELTEEVLRQVRRLDRTVKDLLRYSKPKPPELIFSKINEVIKKASFFVLPEAAKLNISIDFNINEDLPAIKIDSDQIQQVFLNLMINSVQALPSGGKLTISTAISDYEEIKDKIKIPRKGDKYLTIQFQDSGEGIPAKDMKHIFQLFYTKKQKGTGLGLFISQRIIKDHGGNIVVESEVGKGSVFTVYLPYIVEKNKYSI